MKFIKKAFPIVALFVALISVAICLIKFWDKVLLLVVNVMEKLDPILKRLFPEKPQKGDMSDYDDI